MKIRIYKNSVRFRLDMEDIEQLDATGLVTAATPFGFGQNHVLTYMVALVDLTDINVSLEGQNITLSIPIDMGKGWIKSADLGLYYKKKFGDDQLDIIIEKDLKCLDNTHEDQSKMFPHPKAD